jgi:hypothetical protein
MYPNEIQELLSSFSCDKNKDLEDFLLNENKAISFEKRQITKTYLFVDTNINKVVAYYTLSLNIFSTSNLSKSLIKKLDGIDKNRDNIASYLIAQLGKSSKCNNKIGKYILIDAIDTIKQAVNIVGGRFLIIDAINNKKMIDFYTKESNFIAIDNINKKTENIRMYYPIDL